LVDLASGEPVEEIDRVQPLDIVPLAGDAGVLTRSARDTLRVWREAEGGTLVVDRYAAGPASKLVGAWPRDSELLVATKVGNLVHIARVRLTAAHLGVLVLDLRRLPVEPFSEEEKQKHRLNPPDLQSPRYWPSAAGALTPASRPPAPGPGSQVPAKN
jgi:hypothetical protein